MSIEDDLETGVQEVIECNDPNEYQGQPCTVVNLMYLGYGAENIRAVIKIGDSQLIVPFMKLRYQCCSECGY